MAKLLREWPKTVPVLKACDICKYQLNGPDGTHCLTGWRQDVFGYWMDEADVIARTVAQTMGRAAAAASGAKGVSDSPTLNTINFNDKRTGEESAALWNGVMERLGYVRDAADPDRFILPDGIEPSRAAAVP